MFKKKPSKGQKKTMKMVFESQKPLHIPMKRMLNGIEIESQIFIGFSKPQTYRKPKTNG